MLKGFNIRIGDGDQENDDTRDGQDNIANVLKGVLRKPCACGAIEKQSNFIGEEAHADSDEGAGDGDPFLVFAIVKDSQNSA